MDKTDPREERIDTPHTPGDTALESPVEGPSERIDPGELEGRIVDALKTVYDPEIPVDIYELGLIYDVHVGRDGRVDIRMTLTAPACPAAGILPGEVESKVKGMHGVREARVELVWDPPWDPERMSDAAKLELGLL